MGQLRVDFGLLLPLLLLFHSFLFLKPQSLLLGGQALRLSLFLAFFLFLWHKI
jgi:hypothetical protein